jgi:hypothetical protein
MVAISYFFYKLFLTDFIVSSVYTKEVMPPKRARVSAECAIANIMQFMRFMEQYDNNDSVTVM